MTMYFREQQDAKVAQALTRAGFGVASVYDLVNSATPYPGAIPILLRCLEEIEEPWVKQGVVRALTVKEAKGIADEILLREFERIGPEGSPMQQSLKWAIGNALSVVATEKSFAEVVSLVLNKQHGRAREMLAVALGNMKNPTAVDILIDLLQDDEVTGHALVGLRKLRAKKARPHIEPFLKHSRPWIRKEAAKTLATLRR